MHEINCHENWHALFVVTGREVEVKNLLYREIEQKDIIEYNLIFIVPEIENNVKRDGIWQMERGVLFSGYVLLGADKMDDYIYNKIVKISNVIRFIKLDSYLCKISHEEMHSLGEWVNEDKIVENSIIDLDNNDRVIVIDGPLKGHEGEIIRLDKHKRKIVIKVKFMGRATELKLSFEFLKKAELNYINCEVIDT